MRALSASTFRRILQPFLITSLPAPFTPTFAGRDTLSPDRSEALNWALVGGVAVLAEAPKEAGCSRFTFLVLHVFRACGQMSGLETKVAIEAGSKSWP